MQTYTNPEYLETLRQEAHQAQQLEPLRQRHQKRLRIAYKTAKYALRLFFTALVLEPMRGLQTADGR